MTMYMYSLRRLARFHQGTLGNARPAKKKCPFGGLIGTTFWVVLGGRKEIAIVESGCGYREKRR